MQFQSGRPAQTAHDHLVTAIETMDQAQHCAVLWFADIMQRKLYRQLGYSSMQQYAAVALKFSRTRVHDFLRLARRLEDLPVVKAKVASGELGYTKAREIVKVASPRTEAQWVAAAASLSRRELEAKVGRVRRKARQRKDNAAQVALLTEPAEAGLARAVPVRIGLNMTAEQAARYEALWQKLGTVPNAEDLLEALAVLVEERGTSAGATDCKNDACDEVFPRGDGAGHHPPVQIHVHRCPDCGAVETAGRALDRADRERTGCDAAISKPGARNTTTIPPKTRREVLARDRHRCRLPGCSHTRFLEIHHRVPRTQGGTNDPDNLVTLCAGCHRLVHERRIEIRDLRPRAPSSPSPAP